MGNLTTSADTTVIDFVPTIGPDGRAVWTAPEEAGPGDIALADGVLQPLAHADDAGGLVAAPWGSTLPTERMAGGRGPVDKGTGAASWEEVARLMRSLENGDRSGDVVMGPGGTLTVTGPGASSTAPFSVLPTERMAAPAPTISMDDVAQIRRIDPYNVEGWTPVHNSVLDGWRFSLQVAPMGFRFVFLVFRSPNDGGFWRIWVLRPNADEQFGHEPHMIATYVNGERVPVICGAGGRAHPTLTEARVNAGKWALYTQRRMWGQDVLLSA